MSIGDIPASSILAIATIVAAGIVGVTLIGLSSNIAENLKKIQENSNQLAGTDLKIIQVSYSNGELQLWVKNTGIREIENYDKASVFIEGEGRIGIDFDDTSDLLNSTDINNNGIWDPKETVTYIMNVDLDSGVQYTVKVVSYNGGASDTYIFTV